MFNALKYIKRLEAVGVPRKQAEAHVQLYMDSIDVEIATKSDVAELKGEMAALRGEVKGEFAGLRGEVKAEIAELRGEIADLRGDVSTLRSQVTEIKSELLMKLGGLILATFTITTSVLGWMIQLKVK